MKKLFIIIALPLLTQCKPKLNDSQNLIGWQKLDLNNYQISIPPNWKYIQEQGEDSFVGLFKGPNVSLSFDFSEHGFANHLLQTEQEYIDSEDWLQGCIFCKSGVTYVNSQIPDRYANKHIHIPTAKQKAKYPKADYIVDLTYKGDTAYVPIEVPQNIKNANIEVDTNKKYVVKTISSKISGKGLTGVYYQSRSSNLNFQLSGYNLSKQNQEMALQAFKTIVIKNSK